MSAVSTVGERSVNFHDTPPEWYAKLVELYGEQSGAGGVVRWVTVGAGAHELTFFGAQGGRMSTGGEPVYWKSEDGVVRLRSQRYPEYPAIIAVTGEVYGLSRAQLVELHKALGCVLELHPDTTTSERETP